MRFQIRELVLWPRDPRVEPRRLRFEPGALNVISGWSRTGKSAVIPIVDYCLGSGTCAIPTTTIRERCSWFGIVVETELGMKLLARREPGTQRSTDDMFIIEAESIQIPQSIEEKNTTADAVRRSLDQLAGLTLLDFDPEGSGRGFKGRPSFRDFMAFTMQPQNIVANQNILFFKADAHEHREKLRTIFPYVLGALSPEIMAKQHELGRLRRELAQKERELTALQAVSAKWVSEIRAWASQARELGILRASPPDDAPLPSVIDELRHATQAVEHASRVTQETMSAAIEELLALQREESDRANQVAQLRRRLSEMEQLRQTATQHQQQLYVQRDRLKVAEWLVELDDGEQTCALCEQKIANGHDRLEPLIGALRRVERSAGQFAGVPAAFDRELTRVRGDLRNGAEQLEGVRHRIRALSHDSEEAKSLQDATLESSRFLGRLEQALYHYERLGKDEDLATDIDALRESVAALESDVQEAEIQRRTNRALDAVSRKAGEILPSLDVEWPDAPVALAISDLTVRISREERDDYLWEVGSGSNWLSYHIAMLLALQEYFLSRPTSPVPGFLIFDQPSQVYFPKRLAGRRDEDSGGEPEWQDADVDAVRMAFQTLSSAVARSQGRLQIIVLDHATETVWGGVEPLSLVADWRDGDKLVPESWSVGA